MEAGQDAATTPSFILASFTPGNSGVLSQVTNLDQERSQTENAISVVLEYGFSTVDIWGQSVLCDGGLSWALRAVGQHPRSPPTRCQETPRRPQLSQPQMSHRCQNHPRVRTTALERHPRQRQRWLKCPPRPDLQLQRLQHPSPRPPCRSLPSSWSSPHSTSCNASSAPNLHTCVEAPSTCRNFAESQPHARTWVSCGHGPRDVSSLAGSEAELERSSYLLLGRPLPASSSPSPSVTSYSRGGPQASSAGPFSAPFKI